MVVVFAYHPGRKIVVAAYYHGRTKAVAGTAVVVAAAGTVVVAFAYRPDQIAADGSFVVAPAAGIACSIGIGDPTAADDPFVVAVLYHTTRRADNSVVVYFLLPKNQDWV